MFAIRSGVPGCEHPGASEEIVMQIDLGQARRRAKELLGRGSGRAPGCSFAAARRPRPAPRRCPARGCRGPGLPSWPALVAAASRRELNPAPARCERPSSPTCLAGPSGSACGADRHRYDIDDMGVAVELSGGRPAGAPQPSAPSARWTGTSTATAWCDADARGSRRRLVRAAHGRGVGRGTPGRSWTSRSNRRARRT